MFWFHTSRYLYCINVLLLYIYIIVSNRAFVRLFQKIESHHAYRDGIRTIEMCSEQAMIVMGPAVSVVASECLQRSSCFCSFWRSSSVSQGQMFIFYNTCKPALRSVRKSIRLDGDFPFLERLVSYRLPILNPKLTSVCC